MAGRTRPGLDGLEWPAHVPYRVFGPGASILPRGVRTIPQGELAAETILDKHGDWLGATPTSVKKFFFAENDSHVLLQYQQLHRGVPVDGAILIFTFHKADGRLVCMGSEAIKGLTLKTIPKLDKLQAMARYQALTGWNEKLGTILEAPHLEIRQDENGTYRFGYRISANFEHKAEGWTIWIDAVTGAEIARESTIHECGLTHSKASPMGPVMQGVLKGKVTGMASPLPRGVESTKNPEKALPIAGVEITVSGVGTTYTDKNGDFSLSYSGTKPVAATISLQKGRWWGRLYDYSGSSIHSLKVNLDPSKTNNLLFNPKPPSSPNYLTAQVNGVKYTADMHDFAKSAVPTMTAIDRKINVYVNRNASCNAFFNGSSIVFYRKRGSCNNTASGSVVAHEYGHAIDWWNGGIGRNPATPSEGFADVCSAFLLDHPVVGLDFRTNGGFVRTALNSITWPYTGNSQQVHLVGQAYLGWAWNFLGNMRSKYGKTLGKTLADKSVMKVAQANPRSHYDYILQTYIANDNDSNLNNGTPDIGALWKASLKRHFLRPIFSAIKVQHKRMTDQTDGSKGFTILASVDNQAGTLKTADLYFDAGKGSFTKIAMKLVSGKTWSAQTPAVALGKMARYYFSLTNDRSANLKLPIESGSYYTFAVGYKKSLLADDFEKSNSNFSASNGSSTNGWSRHVPAGRNFDPTAAVSGSYVWGSNRNSSDERFYNRAQTVSLTSKSVSTKGMKGMRLRFDRWLTSYTRSWARVYVNGTKVFDVNRSSSQEWKTIDLDISAIADDRSSVVVRFELRHAPTSTRDYALGGLEIDNFDLYSLSARAGTYVSFGKACLGSAGTPSLSASNKPTIGQTLNLVVASAKASSGAAMFTGLSKTNLGVLSLPLDLTALGAKGCSLFVSTELFVPFATDSAGKASVGYALPNIITLVGSRFYQQALILDAKANQLGLVLTNAGMGTIGG